MSKQNHPVFSFQNQQIRTTIIDNQPWFVAKDVSAALGIQWTGHVLGSVPGDWQGVVKLTTPHKGGNQHLRIINEPAVYKLAFRSNKPEADAFTDWVASEVLPSIRKTGKYEAKPQPRCKALPQGQPKALPSSHTEIDALLGKVRFYIGEIAEVEKRIADILDEATLPALRPFPGIGSPSLNYVVNAGCSTQYLWGSIDFALKAVEASINVRLRNGT